MKYLVLAFVAAVGVSCTHSTAPENPREYNWDVSVLSYEGSLQTTMYSIWGSSPSDVYASGSSRLGGLHGAVYHFKGQQWFAMPLPSGAYNNMEQISGFSASDIWVAGAEEHWIPMGEQGVSDSALVLHFIGYTWKSMLPSHMGVRGLKSMCGISPSDLYFGSNDGRVLHCNGPFWTVDTLYVGLSVKAIGGDASRVFAMANSWRGSLDDSVFCFTKDTAQWRLVDAQSFNNQYVAPRFGLSSVFCPAPGTYYSSTYTGVFQWRAGSWVKVLTVNGFISSLAGSADNILAVGGGSGGPLVYHWDGKDWGEIKLKPELLPTGVMLYSAWTNGREAFIVGNDGDVTYVLHGK
jgi:hypothetical protein